MDKRKRTWLIGLGLGAALAAGVSVKHLRPGAGDGSGAGPNARGRTDGRLAGLANLLAILGTKSGTSGPPTDPAPSAKDLPAEARERDQQLAEVRASGDDGGELGRETQAIARAWAALAGGPGVEAAFGPWECHRSGCFVTVVHRSGASVETLTSEILASREAADWPGPKMRSAPIRRSDGSTEVTWLLLAGAPQAQGEDQGEDQGAQAE